MSITDGVSEPDDPISKEGPAGSELISAVVVAGGRSSRFGRDKATHLVEGRMLADRLARCAGQVAGKVWIGLPAVVDSPTGYAGRDPWQLLRQRFEVVEDDPPHIGPIGSLRSALRSASTPWVLLLACDLPGLAVEDLEVLVCHALRAETGVDVVAATDPNGEVQPLVAMYHSRLLSRIEEAIRRGENGLRRLIRGVAHQEVVLKEEALVNMNHPEDTPVHSDSPTSRLDKA